MTLAFLIFAGMYISVLVNMRAPTIQTGPGGGVVASQATMSALKEPLEAQISPAQEGDADAR
jgi:hypothetical protein